MSRAIALVLLILACSLIAPVVVWRQTRSVSRGWYVWKSWMSYMGAMAAFGAVVWFLTWLGG